jgi:hypothetical protein
VVLQNHNSVSFQQPGKFGLGKTTLGAKTPKSPNPHFNQTTHFQNESIRLLSLEVWMTGQAFWWKLLTRLWKSLKGH